MSGQFNDMTRWNRAGLSRFRYIDGNAVTFLEDIRMRLQKAFPTWDHVNPILSVDEAWEDTRHRLETQYFGPRQEWAWEIARSFVRALHILTEHMNAFSNEGYLRTATQWEYLRRLLDMLDYRPRPPSSAVSLMALIARTDVTPVNIEKGLQVSVTPDDGRARLVFESLDDFELDPALNGLRLMDWNYSPQPLSPYSDYVWPLPKKHKVSIGQVGVLVQGDSAFAVQIIKQSDGFITIKFDDASDLPEPDYIKGDARLWLEPEDIQSCALNGAQTYRLKMAEQYSPRQVIALTTGNQSNAASTYRFPYRNTVREIYDSVARQPRFPTTPGTTGGTGGGGVTTVSSYPYAFAEIEAVDRFGFKLGKIVSVDMQAREFKHILTHKIVSPYTGFPHDQSLEEEIGSLLIFNPPSNKNKLVLASGNSQSGLGDIVNSTNLIEEGDTYRVDVSSQYDRAYTIDKSKEPVESLGRIQLDDALDQLILEGSPGNIQTGDYMVMESAAGEKNAQKVLTVVVHEDSFAIHFYNPPKNLNDVARLYGPFKHELRPVGYDRDSAPVNSGALTLELKASELASALVTGKTVIVEPEEGYESGAKVATETEVITPVPFSAKISDINIVDDTVSISLDSPPESYAGFNRGNIIIRGNCSLFGHGETQPPIILGSGDASKNNQTFLVKRDNISFVFDSSLEWGVRADIDLRVEGRRYHQVSTLRASKPGDAHYTITLAENGFLKIGFGDGQNGRRLPSGYNNVRMGFRVGSGREGNNLSSGALNDLIKSDIRTVEVRQPLGTSGGEDRESPDQIRENAPRHLRTLERAISLSDFEHIAKATAGVWQARAVSSHQGVSRGNNIIMTIVPAHNAPLEPIADSIKARLIAVSPPSTYFTIVRYDPVILSLEIDVRIDTRNYDKRAVITELRERLFNHLQLRNRQPGQRLFTSELYKIIEGQSGVVNSQVKLFPNSTGPIIGESGEQVKSAFRDANAVISTVTPLKNQVIYLESAQAIGIIPTEVAS